MKKVKLLPKLIKAFLIAVVLCGIVPYMIYSALVEASGGDSKIVVGQDLSTTAFKLNGTALQVPFSGAELSGIGFNMPGTKILVPAQNSVVIQFPVGNATVSCVCTNDDIKEHDFRDCIIRDIKVSSVGYGADVELPAGLGFKSTDRQIINKYGAVDSVTDSVYKYSVNGVRWEFTFNTVGTLMSFRVVVG